MGIEEKEVHEGIERWVDERIRARLSNLPLPFETQIKKLQKRVDGLKERFQRVVQHADPEHRKTPKNE